MSIEINYDHIREGLLSMCAGHLHTLGSIGYRASQVMGWPHLSRKQFDLQGYIVLFHRSCALDLNSLLDSTDEDFLHDVSGMLSTILYQVPGGYFQGFIPKCAKKNQEVPS